MESNQSNLSTLEQLEQNSRRQLHYARLQCLFTIIGAAICVILLVVVIGIIPKLSAAVTQVNALAVQAETVMDNLETVTSALAKADIAQMVSNVDALAAASQAGVAQALEKFDAIDIEALNQAISDLCDVVAPLAKLSKAFG